MDVYCIVLSADAVYFQLNSAYFVFGHVMKMINISIWLAIYLIHSSLQPSFHAYILTLSSNAWST